MEQHVYPSLAYEDAERAIAWLEEAFGFEPRLVVPGERGVLHAELHTGGDNVVMVLSTSESRTYRRQRSSSPTNGAAPG